MPFHLVWHSLPNRPSYGATDSTLIPPSDPVDLPQSSPEYSVDWQWDFDDDSELLGDAISSSRPPPYGAGVSPPRYNQAASSEAASSLPSYGDDVSPPRYNQIASSEPAMIDWCITRGFFSVSLLFTILSAAAYLAKISDAAVGIGGISFYLCCINFLVLKGYFHGSHSGIEEMV